MDWLVKNWVGVGAAAIAVVVIALIVFAALGPLGYPSLPAPGANPTVQEANIAVGGQLIRWGLAITLLAFVPALLLSVIGAFRVEKVVPPKEFLTGTTRRNAAAAVAVPVKEVLAAIPDVLKVPGGFGILLIFLGAVIMTGTAFGAGGGSGASPTPTAAEEPGGG